MARDNWLLCRDHDNRINGKTHGKYYVERIHGRTNGGPTNEILLREENEKKRATSKRTVTVSLFRILAACANKKFNKTKEKKKGPCITINR